MGQQFRAKIKNLIKMKETGGGDNVIINNFNITLIKYLLCARYVWCSKSQLPYINYLI